MADTYVLDGSPEDLDRLVGIAALQDQLTRDALAATDLSEGWRVLDCGCGPIGALPVLAERVGTTGRVVGIERHAPTAERARAVVAHLGLSNVTVVTADLNDPDGPVDKAGDRGFDLAYSRCFLMHQPDVETTLSRIAQRIRPGGWLIAQEPLRVPEPQAHPPLPSLAQYWDLMHEASCRLGVAGDAVASLPAAADAIGLIVQRCCVIALSVSPTEVLHLHAATVEAARERIVDTHAGTEAQVEAQAAALRTAATSGRHAWATTPFFLTMVCRLDGTIRQGRG